MFAIANKKLSAGKPECFDGDILVAGQQRDHRFVQPGKNQKKDAPAQGQFQPALLAQPVIGLLQTDISARALTAANRSG